MAWLNPPVPDLQAALAAQGPAGYWRVVLKENEDRRKKDTAAPTGFAMIYTHLGDRQRALWWLEQAVEERDPWVVYIKVEPAFASLRGDARFQQIVRSAGIP
jgi:hypothetical protein